MTMEIRRVQDRNANRIGLQRGSRASQRWDCADQSRPANELQEIAPRPVSVRMKHRLNFRLIGILPVGRPSSQSKCSDSLS